RIEVAHPLRIVAEGKRQRRNRLLANDQAAPVPRGRDRARAQSERGEHFQRPAPCQTRFCPEADRDLVRLDLANRVGGGGEGFGVGRAVQKTGGQLRDSRRCGRRTLHGMSPGSDVVFSETGRATRLARCGSREKPSAASRFAQLTEPENCRNYQSHQKLRPGGHPNAHRAPISDASVQRTTEIRRAERREPPDLDSIDRLTPLCSPVLCVLSPSSPPCPSPSALPSPSAGGRRPS